MTPTLRVEYIRGSDWGGGVGGLLYSIRSGIPSFTHSNSRGDVTTKTDGTGAVTWQAGYEAFGTRPNEVGSTLDRQKANTKEEDPTGLLNEGFRYRDLETGEFITRDPAGFVDGPNLYTYVLQNPWSKFDPHGLETQGDYQKKIGALSTQLASISSKDVKTARDLKHQIAVLQRRMESIEITARLINATKQAGDADVKPALLDDASKSYHDAAEGAIRRMGGWDSPWMSKMAHQIGITHDSDQPNHDVVAMLKAVGADANSSWCGAAMNAAINGYGTSPKNAARASSWLTYGQPVKTPQMGDLMIMTYDNGTGHVTIVVGMSKDGSQVFGLGGNQAKGVNISAFPAQNMEGVKVEFRHAADVSRGSPATIDFKGDPSVFSVLAGLTH